jgi:hypothetical protein
MGRAVRTIIAAEAVQTARQRPRGPKRTEPEIELENALPLGLDQAGHSFDEAVKKLREAIEEL